MLRRIFRGISAIILVLALGIPAGITQANAYGALAYSPSKGIDGYAFNYKSKSAAQKRAMQSCRVRGCRVVASVRVGCAALAVGRKGGWGAGSGNGRSQAKSRAMTECRKYTSGCRVRRAMCSG